MSFDDVVELAAGGLGDGAEIPEHLVRLRLDALDEIARGGIKAELAGQVDRVAGADTLRVRPEGGRCVLGMDGFFRHGFRFLGEWQSEGNGRTPRTYAPHPIGLYFPSTGT